MENPNKLKLKIKINWKKSAVDPPPKPALKAVTEPQAVEVLAPPPALPMPEPIHDNFDGDLVLTPLAQKPVLKAEKIEKAPSPQDMTIAQLSALGEAPEGMDGKAWELKICAERLVNLFKLKMKERWDVNVMFVTPAERSCFKNFYRYLQDLKTAEAIVVYVIDEWPGIKARYRINYEYPVPRVFAEVRIARQIAIEFHRKTNVTHEDPKYIADFKETKSDESEYQSDW